ncbi:hypothetical protein [Pleionea litopenaei]|uniref:5-bromo-4-chloroindolyl phosphate hydrolysis protein n=1 Tax=Pleionea litopenaei TaxID=3070815 RepID=A0AA51RSC4_9GAMM|nr:hypothetical protein [Pleionea sp. HL-JVS1]WMS86757.1 hypothetical protein Q9312_16165 [Pleionea sp. HL-JVS1]
MKKIAIGLIIVSFLGGAFLASLDAKTLNWNWFIPTILLGFIGAILLKRIEHSDAREKAHSSGSIETLQKCLNNIVSNLEQMNDNKEKLPTYEARFEIDRVFREDLTEFAESRESIRHILGLKDYADIMSAFAAGERYINRVWSASTDGYVDEVKLYIEKASQQFHDAAALFNERLQNNRT